MKKSRLYPFLILLTVMSYFMYTPPSSKKLKAVSGNEIVAKENVQNAVSTLQLAATIGESILKEKYGDDTIEKQKPFSVSLTDDVWTIEGSTSRIEISKSTGSVLALSN